MSSHKEDGLYHDTFSNVMSWLNSATITLLLGGILSLAISFYFHWLLGAVVGFFTLIASIASYIVFKK